MTSEDGNEPSRFLELARTSGQWLTGDGPDSDIVVSSRIRLARNIAGFPFMSKADDDVRRQLVGSLKATIISARPEEEFSFVDVAELNELDSQFLMERQLISRELAKTAGPRGVVIGKGERISIMLNEEDHLRMQVIRSGFALEDCWQYINSLDDSIEEHITFAFDEELGYLTACPTNVGTGIRVSVMLHLPALRITKEIQKVYQAAQKINLAVRGLYGEGSQAMGDFYQISNQVTLGTTEQSLIDNLSEVVPNIINYERRVRELLCRDNKSRLDDQVARAVGILTSARSISSEETMHLLSNLRLGINLGLVPDINIATINELFVHTQPSHLQLLHGSPLKTSDRNEARAEYLRKRLADSVE